jgi:DNA recombination protein RmuC
MVTQTVFWVLALIAAGTAIAYLAFRSGVRSERPRMAELEGRCQALTEQLDTRGGLDATLQPLQQAMTTLSQQVGSAERERVAALTGLSEKVLAMGQQVGEATKDVHQQALRLTQALSRTQHQGSWGEMQLRRLVEASGMLDHVHFVEQVTVRDEGSHVRPDMLIDLGQGRQVVVDAKVSLDAFLDPDLDEQAQARMHSAAVADHVTRLSSKAYWRAVGTPEFVIAFLPAEHMLGVALRERPDLLQSAFDRKVVLATPTTLMATLRSISWAWQQAAMAEQAQDVLAAGRQVHDRLRTMSGHVQRLGKSLGDAVTGYNQFVGSLDSRVLPAARRLAQMTAPESEVVHLSEVDVRPRSPHPADAPTLSRDTG